MTAISFFPAATHFPRACSRAFPPPKIMSCSFISVQITSGSSNASTTRYPRRIAPFTLLESNWMVKWAQLFGEWRTVVRPSIDVQTDDAPLKAQPFSGSSYSAILEE